MLTFRNTSIAVILLLILCWVLAVAMWITVAILFIYSLLLFWGSYRVDSGFYMPTINRGPSGRNQISLSFDDGPKPLFTASILDVLKEKGVQAAFFCIGKNIEENQSLLHRIYVEGHVIGNHSFSHHRYFDLYSASRMETELKQTNESIRKITGRQPLLFRPPYGVTNPNLAKAVRACKMKAIGWNVRSLDTVAEDAQSLFDKLVRSLQPGAIILFHDTAEITLRILPAFIEEIRNKGFEIVRLDQLINEKPYE